MFYFLLTSKGCNALRAAHGLRSIQNIKKYEKNTSFLSLRYKTEGRTQVLNFKPHGASWFRLPKVRPIIRLKVFEWMVG